MRVGHKILDEKVNLTCWYLIMWNRVKKTWIFKMHVCI